MRDFLGSPITVLLCLAVSVFAVLFMTPKTVSAAPFTCSTDFYWIVDQDPTTQMFHGDPATGDIDTVLGPVSAVGGYNAIGYNPIDNYVWGMSTEGATEARLVRVEADGTASMPYGSTPTGLPVESYQAGAFDEDGTYWVQPFFSDGTKLYAVNVAANTAVELTLTQAIPHHPDERIVDLAYYGGYLYAFNAGPTNNLRTYRINVDSTDGITDGTVTVSSPMTGMNLNSGTMGFAPALWSTSDGRIYTYYGQGDTGENGIYEIQNYNDTNPQYVFRNDLNAPSSGDGASCIAAASPYEIKAEPKDFESNPVDTCGGGTVGNVLTGDTLYGDSLNPSSVNLTLVNSGGLAGVTLQPNGDLQVAAGCKVAGAYIVVYQICDAANPDTCDSANVTVRILGASTSDPDSPTPGELAPTGQNIMPIVLAGGVLVVVSLGLIFRRNIRALTNTLLSK